jgi:hypothetical protein
VVRRLVSLIAAVAAVATLGIVGSTPAVASQAQVCGNGGSGYCLNDWGGQHHAGDAIKMYYGNSSNEDFVPTLLSGMCNHGYATSTCPINVPGINLSGSEIAELKYGPGGCLVTTGSALAVLGTCADGSGNGGSNGIIMVTYEYNNQCTGAKESYLADRYWTNRDQQIVSLTSGGNPGLQAYFAIGSITCWGWPTE